MECSLGLDYGVETSTPRVLILILMECSLGTSIPYKGNSFRVLILILMECSLGSLRIRNKLFGKRLNPYSNGMLTWTNRVSVEKSTLLS